ncbi:hypothetical protein [Stenotrophomonas sp.]|uniref:hypothetical protein n=1 Tax=Stenotrophomonas sp. TaxID=69392 RepID=UPI0028AA09EA|nr:hypothetical protein [Stenotrophomonas sp.]
MECEQPDRARGHIRQGDVLAAHPGTENWSNRWARFYIVLSADCDIVNNKLDTGLVVVPVVGLHTYALDIWLPEQIKSLIEYSANKGLSAAVRKLPELTVDHQRISEMDDASLDILFADEKLRARKSEAKRIRSICLALTELRLLSHDIEGGASDVHDLVKRYCGARDKVYNNSNCPQKELKGAFSSLSDSDRVDYWPMIDLVSLDNEMREDEPYAFVAALRRFKTIPLSSAILEQKKWLEDKSSYLRTCRLRGIYKSDFLSKFANLFTRVGLDSTRGEDQARAYERASTPKKVKQA